MKGVVGGGGGVAPGWLTEPARRAEFRLDGSSARKAAGRSGSIIGLGSTICPLNGCPAAARSKPQTHPRRTRVKTLAGNWKQEGTPKKSGWEKLNEGVMERILH